jgi:hypothetical protein
LLIGAAVCGFAAVRPIWDVDIFWHITAGQWILEHTAFPNLDIFSFVEPIRTWVTFQWLYEVLCALVEDDFGLTGVRVFHALATASGTSLFVWFAIRYLNPLKSPSGLPLILLVLVLTALLVALYADRVRARPHVFNLIGWSLCCGLLLTSSAHRKILVGLSCLVLFIWSNLHAGGSFIFLIAALAIPVAATFVHFFPGNAQRRWTATVSSVGEGWMVWGFLLGSCLAAPNWVRGVWQAYAMMGGSEQLIEEWLPFWHYFAVGAHPLHYLSGIMPVVILPVVVWVAFRPGTKHLDVILIALACAFLPYRSARFVYYEVFALTLVLPYLPTQMLVPIRRRVGMVGAAVVALILLTTTADFHTRAQFASLSGYAQALEQDIDARRFPVEMEAPINALLGLRSTDKPLKIFCIPNWGGYLLYKHYPEIRVIADGRGNFSTDLANRIDYVYWYRHLPETASLVERIFTESGADLVVIQRTAFAPGYKPVHWQPVFRSNKGEIWIRNELTQTLSGHRL